MRKIIKIKIPKAQPRNPVALPARLRKAGPLKDRRDPKGGTRNLQNKWLEEWEEDSLSDEE
jgi:hypothetical protein